MLKGRRTHSKAKTRCYEIQCDARSVASERTFIQFSMGDQCKSRLDEMRTLAFHCKRFPLQVRNSK